MSLSSVVQRHRRALFTAAAVTGVMVVGVLLWNPVVAWFSGNPISRGGSTATAVTPAGGLMLKLSLRPDPPREKGNTLFIEVEDPAGKRVPGADVKVAYSMPAMGAMPEMRGVASVEPAGDGQYRARFDLPMGGTWTLETQVKASTAEATARHTMTVGSKGLSLVGAEGSGAVPAKESATAVQPFQFQGPALELLRAAFQSYDSVRALLARDSMDGLAAQAEALAASLRAAADAARGSPADVAECLEHGEATAKQLAAARDIEEARQRFSTMSGYVVALASADTRLQEGWHIFECPMQKGFNKWFQRSEKLENPYMGQKMLGCGSPSKWTIPVTDGAAASSGHEHAEGEISHYTCSMHPSVKQEGRGTCPICSMGLVPVTKEEVESGVIRVDEMRRQRIGVRTRPVVSAPMDLSIRALGRIAYDETALVDVTLKLDGYIHGLKVNATGEPVRKGDVLFRLYSPELYASQEEYLLARNSRSEANASLVRAARKRLELWGLAPWQIEKIAEKGEPIQDMPFLSPASGYVIEKNVVEGAAVKAGERLFRIAPLEKVWVQADVYEHDLRYLKVGQRVEVTLPYLPGKKYQGRISYIYPSLEGATRTGRIRVELPNQDLELKPDMYADVRFEVKGGVRLQVPEEAVIYTGPRRLVFVDLGDGRLKPQEVKLGLKTDDAYEVLEGLKEGEKVVTSGNFLIAAESRIRSAALYWTGASDESK